MATRIKRYEEQFVRLDELLARIEREMGPDAQLEVRKYTKGAVLGFIGGQKMVEVIASLEVDGAGSEDAADVLATEPGMAADRTGDAAPAASAWEPAAAAEPAPQPAAPEYSPEAAAPAGQRVNVVADNAVRLPVANDEVDSLAALLAASGLRFNEPNDLQDEDGASAPAVAYESQTPLPPRFDQREAAALSPFDHPQPTAPPAAPAEPPEPAAAELEEDSFAPDTYGYAPAADVYAPSAAAFDYPSLDTYEPEPGQTQEQSQAEYETALAMDMAQNPWQPEPAPEPGTVQPMFSIGTLRPADPPPPAVAEPAGEPASASPSALAGLSQPALDLEAMAPEEPARPAPAPPPVYAAPRVAAEAVPAAAPETLQQIGELQQSISGLQATMQQLVSQQQSMLDNATQAAVAAAQAVVAAERELRQDERKAEDRRRRNEAVAVERRAKKAAATAAPAAAGEIAPSAVNPLLLDPAGGFAAVQRQVYDRLLDWNIGHYDAVELINSALTRLEQGSSPSSDELTQAISEEICRNVLLGDGIKLVRTPPGKVVALVGATGVGKTTTIAKLAALFAFQLGKKVSLVSLDNYRIAAAEQLRTYADIMGIDLDIVFSKDEFDSVLSRRRSSDLVLVDTAGRSPNNTKQIYELREIFAVHPPDEVHLVMAASTKRDDMQLLLDAFTPLSYDHVMVSKLDETRSLGAIYNLTKHCKLPISYFTVGQSVPEDLRTATLPFIQKWISQGRIL